MGLVRRVRDRHILVDQPPPTEQQSDEDEDMPDSSAPAAEDPPATSAPMPERPSPIDPSASTSIPTCDHSAQFSEILHSLTSFEARIESQFDTMGEEISRLRGQFTQLSDQLHSYFSFPIPASPSSPLPPTPPPPPPPAA